jgi:hypothetical protein
VIDQIASLTDPAATAWHRQLIGATPNRPAVRTVF